MLDMCLRDFSNDVIKPVFDGKDMSSSPYARPLIS